MERLISSRVIGSGSFLIFKNPEQLFHVSIKPSNFYMAARQALSSLLPDSIKITSTKLFQKILQKNKKNIYARFRF